MTDTYTRDGWTVTRDEGDTFVVLKDDIEVARVSAALLHLDDRASSECWGAVVPPLRRIHDTNRPHTTRDRGSYRVGLLVRGEDRGLGIQTWEAYRHLNPDRTLLIDTSMVQIGYPVHYERYPDATRTELGDGDCLDEHTVRAWLDGLDIVFSCETLYDRRFCDWARAAGVKTVVQFNPEFFQADGPEQPDQWWNPSTWRMDVLPAGTRHVPVPVALDRFPVREPMTSGRPRFLHTVGRPATADRAGTEVVGDALRLCGEPLDFTIAAQEPTYDVSGRCATQVQYRIGTIDGYWNNYVGFDVLVLPRRYGGLSLPTQEAMAAGLAVVMPDCSPNVDMWPVIPLASNPQNRLDLPCGPIHIAHIDPDHLAHVLRRLDASPHEVAEWQVKSRQWAVEHSWQALLPVYEREFSLVLDGASMASG